MSLQFIRVIWNINYIRSNGEELGRFELLKLYGDIESPTIKP